MGYRERFERCRDAVVRAALAAGLLIAAAVLAGCSPKVGDHCVLNTDCGSSGILVCDTSLPNGYCTQFNCATNSCQNSAACVAFEPAVPGCPYDDYMSPARTTRTFCMAHCNSDSDCRQSDGYICADPREPPYDGVIIDDTPQNVCLPGSSTMAMDVDGSTTLPEGSVCSPTGPVWPLDAAFLAPPGDAGDDGEGDASGDASGDTGAESGADAGGADGAPADGPGDDTGDAGAPGAQDAQDEG